MGYKQRSEQQELIVGLVGAMGEMSKREIKDALGKRVPDLGTLGIWLVELVDHGVLELRERTGSRPGEFGGTVVVRTVVYSATAHEKAR